MKAAQAKLTDLQTGTDFLRTITMSMERHGSGGSGSDADMPTGSKGPTLPDVEEEDDEEPPYP